MIIKRVGVLSLGKIWGVLYGAFGLVVGATLTLYWLGHDSGVGSVDAEQSLAWSLFGVGAVVALPVTYSGIGFCLGLAAASSYNWIARVVGGIEIDLE